MIDRDGRVCWIEPGVLLVSPPGPGDEPRIHAYYAAILARVEERGAPYAIITDARGRKHVPSAKERRLHSELSDELARRAPPCVLSVAVIESVVMRAAVRAICWLGAHGMATETVGSLDEARVRCREALRPVRCESAERRGAHCSKQ